VRAPRGTGRMWGMARTGETQTSLMHGPWSSMGERGRGEAWGAWTGPEKKEEWAEPG
jgi:hypothetical protein